MNLITNLSPKALRQAADIKERIDTLQSELKEILGGEVPSPAQTTEAPKKYKFSVASRAKMRAAQKARWAKIKGTAPSPEPALKPKRKFSAQDWQIFELGLQRDGPLKGKRFRSRGRSGR